MARANASARRREIVIIAIQCETTGSAGVFADASGASWLLAFLTNRNVEYRSTGSTN
jgi:hypothetical protein